MSTAAPVASNKMEELLVEARTRTLELVEDLTDEQMLGPMLTIVNPPLWEIGHVAWFMEKWSLRHLRNRKPLRADADALYDSAAIPHDSRWSLPLPDRARTLAYMNSVLEAVIADLPAGMLSPAESYFHLLPLYHEAMHAEALAYTRQTHGYAAPAFPESGGDGPGRAAPTGAGALPGDVEVPGGPYTLGSTRDLPFVFDNEKWAHAVPVRAFRIARAPVTNVEFMAFVEAGGYLEEKWWSEAGRQWRLRSAATHPLYWRREASGRWLRKVFDRWLPLQDHLPVVHVNWFEAEAYCGWAGRRLPSEAEWEMAAAGEPRAGGSPADRPLGDRRLYPWGEDSPAPSRANLDWRMMGCVPVDAFPEGDSAWGCRQMLGNVWEWTQDDFQPYPGFVPDPYAEYSAPWFGDHKVLRGGCWTTRSYLIRNTWRNFYTPDRRDVWAGFRTCAVEA